MDTAQAALSGVKCAYGAARVLAGPACPWTDMRHQQSVCDSYAAAACLQRTPPLTWRGRTLRSIHQGSAMQPKHSRRRLLSRTREAPPAVSRTAVTSTCTWLSRARFMAMCSMGGPTLAPAGIPAAAVLACCLMSHPPGDRELATAGLVAARLVRSCRRAAQHTSEQQLEPDGVMAHHPSDAIYALFFVSLEASMFSCPS